MKKKKDRASVVHQRRYKKSAGALKSKNTGRANRKTDEAFRGHPAAKSSYDGDSSRPPSIA